MDVESFYNEKIRKYRPGYENAKILCRKIHAEREISNSLVTSQFLTFLWFLPLLSAREGIQARTTELMLKDV